MPEFSPKWAGIHPFGAYPWGCCCTGGMFISIIEVVGPASPLLSPEWRNQTKIPINPSLQIVQQKETKGQQRIAADMGILKRKFILNKHYPFFPSAFRPGKRVVQNLTQNPRLKDSCYFLTYPTQNQATRFSCSEMSATLKPVAKVQLTSRVPGLTQSVW